MLPCSLKQKKTCVKRQKIGFQDQLSLTVMQVKSIAEFSKGIILQYFLPSLCHHLSLRSLLCLFLSGRFRQVLLYFILEYKLVWSLETLCWTYSNWSLLMLDKFVLGQELNK